MKRILRLYPAGWRERYGQEMESILEERAVGPFEMVDLLLGALDAHLHLRGLGNRSEHRKGITMSLRTAGIAAIAGGTLWGLSWLMMAANEFLGGGDEVPLAIFTVLAASVALLVALAGLSSFQARKNPRVVWASFVAGAIGLVAIIGAWPLMMVTESAYYLFIVGIVAFPLGSIAFGIVTYRTNALSRMAAAALVIGGVVQFIGMVVLFNGAPVFVGPELALMMVGSIGFAAAWIDLGFDAVRRDRLPFAGSATPA